MRVWTVLVWAGIRMVPVAVGPEEEEVVDKATTITILTADKEKDKVTATGLVSRVSRPKHFTMPQSDPLNNKFETS